MSTVLTWRQQLVRYMKAIKKIHGHEAPMLSCVAGKQALPGVRCIQL